MPTLHLALLGTLVLVLASAALGKAVSPETARAGWRQVAPGRWRHLAFGPWALAGSEALIALGLLAPGWLGRLAALAATGLFASFAVMLTRVARRGAVVSCGCFGAWSDEPVTWTTVARAAVLTALAAAYVVVSWPHPGLGAALDTDADHLVAGLVCAALGFTTLMLMTRGAGAATPSVGTGDQTGRPLPALEVVLADGRVVPLRGLAADRSLLLVGGSLASPAALEVLAELPAWQEEYGEVVRIVALTSDDLARVRASVSGLEPLVALGTSATRTALGLTSDPSAVLVGAAGRIATRVAAGSEEVFGLLGGTLEAVQQVTADNAADAD